MRTSDAAQALLEAQRDGDRHAESIAIRAIRIASGKSFMKNRASSGSPLQNFMEKIAFGVSDCWYWTGHVDAIGYGRMAFNGENKAHRIAWRLFNGPIPDGLRVLHKCDVRSCVNPAHLFLGTQRDNVLDMHAKGRGAVPYAGGEKNGNAKLTRETVRAMRERRLEYGESYKTIATQFGVTTMTAFRAIKGKSWK